MTKRPGIHRLSGDHQLFSINSFVADKTSEAVSKRIGKEQARAGDGMEVNTFYLALQNISRFSETSRAANDMARNEKTTDLRPRHILVLYHPIASKPRTRGHERACFRVYRPSG